MIWRFVVHSLAFVSSKRQIADVEGQIGERYPAPGCQSYVMRNMDAKLKPGQQPSYSTMTKPVAMAV